MFSGPPFGVCFGTIMRKNGVWKKSRKTSVKRSCGNGVRRQRRGSAEGGGGFTSELCKFLHYRLARPATSERGAADDGKHAFSMIEVDSSLLEA